MSKLNFRSPKGEFRWAFISGQGRKNELNGKHEFSIEVTSPVEDSKEQIEAIDNFWEENKPKGSKAAKSKGYRLSDDGKHVTFTFKTSTTYQNGEPKTVRVFNAKAQPVELPANQRIGNGSRGRVGGVAAIYDAGSAARGVTLYLDSVQLTKYIAYQGAADFDADEEDGFDGFAEQPDFFPDDEV
jgi:hypothetical protein